MERERARPRTYGATQDGRPGLSGLPLATHGQGKLKVRAGTHEAASGATCSGLMGPPEDGAEQCNAMQCKRGDGTARFY